MQFLILLSALLSLATAVLAQQNAAESEGEALVATENFDQAGVMSTALDGHDLHGE